jgi:hypothetical protein
LLQNQSSQLSLKGDNINKGNWQIIVNGKKERKKEKSFGDCKGTNNGYIEFGFSIFKFYFFIFLFCQKMNLDVEHLDFYLFLSLSHACTHTHKL